MTSLFCIISMSKQDGQVPPPSFDCSVLRLRFLFIDEAAYAAMSFAGVDAKETWNFG